MSKRYLLLMVMILISDACVYAQKKINTYSCRLIHEKFSADSVASFNDQPIVKNKVLSSIKASGSCLEIRIYTAQYPSYFGHVLIITVDQDSIVYNSYGYLFATGRPIRDASWKLAGNDPQNKKVNFYLASKRKVPLQSGLIDKIKDSGIFTIPTWDIERNKLEENNQFHILLDEISPVVEVKLGNRYRNFTIGSTGQADVRDKYIIQLEKIDELIRN